MLVDLKALDVIICEAHADSCNDYKNAHCHLSVECPTEGSSTYQESTDVANKDEKDNNVAVDAVEDEQLMSDDGDELPDQ